MVHIVGYLFHKIKNHIKMKKIIFFFLVSVLTSFTIKAQTVDEIVNKHIEAIGGAKLLESINSMKMEGSIEVQPGMTAPITIQVINEKSLRMDLSIMGMTMNQVIDGESGWMVNPFGGNPAPEPITPDQIKETKGQMDLKGKLYNYAAKGTKVEFVSKDEVEGADVLKLRVTEKDGKVTFTYLDAKTYFIIKETIIVKVDDAETEVNTVYSNFKKTPEGFTFAYTMQNEMAGGPINWEKVEINPKIDPEIFKMPAKN